MRCSFFCSIGSHFLPIQHRMYDWNSNTVVVSIPVHRQLDIQCIPVYPCITAGTTGIIGCARLRSQRLRVFELERLIALIAWPLATDSNLHFVNLVWKAGFGHWFRKRCQQDLFQGPWWFLAAWSWSSQPFSWTHDSKRLSLHSDCHDVLHSKLAESGDPVHMFLHS